MSVLVNVTTTATMTTANVDYTISGKPVGRGRRFAEGERHETRPAGRSCETCLRILSRASGE